MTPTYNPPWLYLLNAMQKEWRTAQILKDRNPDPELEKHLRTKGVWPPPPDRLARGQAQPRAY